MRSRKLKQYINTVSIGATVSIQSRQIQIRIYRVQFCHTRLNVATSEVFLPLQTFWGYSSWLRDLLNPKSTGIDKQTKCRPTTCLVSSYSDAITDFHFITPLTCRRRILACGTVNDLTNDLIQRSAKPVPRRFQETFTDRWIDQFIRLIPLTPTVAICVQVHSILCQTGLSSHL